LEVLLQLGYSNTAKVVYEAVCRRANELNPALCLPLLSDGTEQEHELQLQLAEQMQTQAEDLGC